MAIPGDAGYEELIDLCNEYQELHDGLSNMIEGGRLKKSDVPDDYEWLVFSLETLASHRINQLDDDEA